MLNFKGGFAALLIALVLAEPLRSQEAQNPSIVQVIIDRYLGIQYAKDTVENLDAVLKALGVGLFKRTMARLAIPLDMLTKADDQYTFSSDSLFYNITQVFTPTVPFNYVTPDGRNVTSTFNIEWATLHEVQAEDSGRIVTIDRTFSDDELNIVVTVGHIVARGRYTAIVKPKSTAIVKPNSTEIVKPKSNEETPKNDSIPIA